MMQTTTAVTQVLGVDAGDFVSCSRRIIRLLLEAALSLLPFEQRCVTTPVGATYDGLARALPLCGVSVVRAGESMEQELTAIEPGTPIGKILIQRDRTTKQPHLLYAHLPDDIGERQVLLFEPMLATGGSVLTAIDVLCRAGVETAHIVVVNLLTSRSAIEVVGRAHPEVRIVSSSIEPELNGDAYMIPGIGDFGDRFFGTVAR